MLRSGVCPSTSVLYIDSRGLRMNRPARLIKLLTELAPLEVPYAAGGLKLFNLNELEQRQIGYSIGADGQTLCSPEKGSWLPGWIVIGYDTGLGDPIFIDSETSELPVFTAMEGEGSWDPKPAAFSLDAFTQCWSEFARIAKGRSNPIEEEANPLSEAERNSYLARIREITGSPVQAEFWESQLAYGTDSDS
jgi:hypothetical protein